MHVSGTPARLPVAMAGKSGLCGLKSPQTQTRCKCKYWIVDRRLLIIHTLLLFPAASTSCFQPAASRSCSWLLPTLVRAVRRAVLVWQCGTLTLALRARSVGHRALSALRISNSQPASEPPPPRTAPPTPLLVLLASSRLASDKNNSGYITYII